MDTVRWLYLDLNSFFASCEQQDHPELRGKPVAVVPMLVDSTSVIAASYPAKAFGVKTGTKVGDAKRMCPGIRFVSGNHRRYVEYHHKILEVVESCAPIAGVMSIDEIAVQLTGSWQNVDVAKKLALKIKQAIHSQVGSELKSSIGLAPNRYLAKVAADMQKPDGLTVILKHELPQKLFSLQLQDLPGIGHRTAAKLVLRGIHSVEQLCSYTQSEMEHKIWKSVWGQRMWQWLHGEEVDLPSNAMQSISHQHVLPPRLRNYQGALQVVQKLLIKAGVRLRKANLLTEYLSLNVKAFARTGERLYFDESVRFTETQDTLILLKNLSDLWKQLPRDIKPHRVGIALSSFKDNSQHQFSLFENPRREALNSAIDKLNNKFGRDAVQFGCVIDSEANTNSKIAFNHVPELDEV